MYERILIVVDDATTTTPALQEGLALAKAHGATVVLLGVVAHSLAPVADLPMMGAVTDIDLEQHARQDAERQLQAASALAERAGVRSRSLLDDSLDKAPHIARLATDLHCDLIVVGSEGRNAVMRLITGSLIPGLITHAQVPVLVCRDSSAGAHAMRLADAALPVRRRRAGTEPAGDLPSSANGGTASPSTAAAP